MKTNAPIVLTIFGDERCVVSLDALEAAAHAIHSKAVRERETSAHPSTLGAEIEGQIRLITGESGPLSFVPPHLPFDTDAFELIEPPWQAIRE